MATIKNAPLAQLNAHLAQQVRALRHARGWSLATLADHAGLSKTNVAKIESADGNPSLETLIRLADALDITIGTLLSANRPSGTEVIRLTDAAFVRSESGMLSRALWADGRNRRVETTELTLEPGVDYHSKPHPPGPEDLIVCLTGTLTTGPESHEVTLHPRDSAHFRADIPHRYHSETGCLALCLISYPPTG
jgi:transcriptional regulator with XRE-family HTH domain